MITPEEARAAQAHRMEIERAAAARFKQSAGLRRDQVAAFKELDVQITAYADRHDLVKVDRMLLYDSVRMLFLKVIGLDGKPAREAQAVAMTLLEDHAI